jgi:hypothetical protein
MLPRGASKKIDHVLHQIWIGDRKDNKELTAIENNMLNTHKIFNDTWRIFLWTNNEDSIPEIIKNNPLIEIKYYGQEFSELNSYFTVFQKSKSSLSLLANMVRAAALIKYGGVYLDADYRLCKSLDDLIEQYDFIAGREGNSLHAGNAFIAAHQDHPILNGYLEMILNNLDPATAPEYVKNSCSYFHWRVLSAGVLAFTLSFLKNAHKNGNKDIVFDNKILLDINAKDRNKILTSESFCEALDVNSYGNDPMSGGWNTGDNQDKIIALGEFYTNIDH